jgi:Cu/Ag efflux protein CusF
MKHLSILISAATLCVGATMASAQAQDHSQHTATPTHTQTAVQMSSGQIVKIDKEAAKLTIKHGPLVNLKMPGMTMAFKVKNPEMLDQVAAGDKVRFVAENVQSALTVTALEAVK